VKAFANTVGLRMFYFGLGVVDVFDRQIELVVVLA
jgi:hypothetical protein